MRSKRGVLGAVFAIVMTTITCAAHAKPTAPLIEQLAAFPKMSGFSLSPDGKHLLALEGRGEDRVILVWNTDALNKAPTVIGSSKMKISGAQFI